MLEVTTISRALGIEIDPYAPDALPLPLDDVDGEKKERMADKLIARYRRIGSTTSSMRTDLQNGQPIEVEVRLMSGDICIRSFFPPLISTSQVIYGVPLRHAKRLGVQVPIFETLYVLLHAINARNMGKIKAVA